MRDAAQEPLEAVGVEDISPRPVAPERVPPNSPRAWLLATRPPTLTAAVAPVLIGVGVAHAAGAIAFGPSVAALVVALALQVGANFANDVYDFEKGADTADRLGPTRAVQAGLISPSAMRRGMWIAFAVAVVAGIYAASVGGWPLLALGGFAIVSAVAYTGGPYPLGYNGLGDVFVFLFFGLIAVCGTVWLNLLALPELAWWAAVPPGALATAILVVNNVRDLAGDRAVGKRTLVARFGRRFGEVEYLLLLAVAYAVPAVLWATGRLGPPILAPFFTLPFAVRLTRGVFQREGRALNAVLVGTARLLVLFAVTFTAGLLLGGG